MTKRPATVIITSLSVANALAYCAHIFLSKWGCQATSEILRTVSRTLMYLFPNSLALLPIGFFGRSQGEASLFTALAFFVFIIPAAYATGRLVDFAIKNGRSLLALAIYAGGSFLAYLGAVFLAFRI